MDQIQPVLGWIRYFLDPDSFVSAAQQLSKVVLRLM